MSGKALAVALIAVIVVAFVGGFLGGRTGVRLALPGRPIAPAAQHHVEIIMDQNHSCRQVDIGTLAPDKFPWLLRANHDTITWDYGVDPNGNQVTVVVTFPQNSNRHVGTPFVDGRGNPKFTFTNGEDSRPPVGPRDGYLFDSVTVGGIPCNNPQDPGVIIDN
jgi:hypothetical protein